MYYIPPNKFIRVKDYTHILSIGEKCTTTILKDFKITKKIFPFDCISITPKIFLKYLENNSSSKRKPIQSEIIQMTVNNLFDFLENNQNNNSKALFIHIPEIINQLTNGRNEQNDILELEKFILETYPKCNFTILSININANFSDTENIKNYNLLVSLSLLNDEKKLVSDYMAICKQYIKQILFTANSDAIVSIITPCSRSDNLNLLIKSIDFTKIKMWYIIYDISNNRKYMKQYLDHPQIVELESIRKCPGGNPGRNIGLENVYSGYVYFLDDDNIIYPSLYKLFPHLNGTNIYTFNQLYYTSTNIKVRLGNRIRIGSIDTAQFIVPRELIGNLRWVEGGRCSDGKFIVALRNKNKESIIFINSALAIYNYIANMDKYDSLELINNQESATSGILTTMHTLSNISTLSTLGI